MISKSDTIIHFYKVESHTGEVGNELMLLMPKQNMLLSIAMGTMRHSRFPHLMANISSIFAGSRKRKTRQLTRPLEPGSATKIKDKLAHIRKHCSLGNAMLTQITAIIG